MSIDNEKSLRNGLRRVVSWLRLGVHKRDKNMPKVQGDELLYNASVCLERSKQTRRAIKVLKQLLKLYPQSQFASGSKELAAKP